MFWKLNRFFLEIVFNSLTFDNNLFIRFCNQIILIVKDVDAIDIKSNQFKLININNIRKFQLFSSIVS